MRCNVEPVLAASLKIFPVFGGISGLNKTIWNIHFVLYMRISFNNLCFKVFPQVCILKFLQLDFDL